MRNQCLACPTHLKVYILPLKRDLKIFQLQVCVMNKSFQKNLQEDSYRRKNIYVSKLYVLEMFILFLIERQRQQ